MAPSRVNTIAAAIPVVVLLSIALTQVYMATFHDLSPWKGGGFGMFSTVDSPGARFIRASVLRDGQPDLPVRLPDHLRSPTSRVRSLPNDALLNELAQHMADSAWVYDADEEAPSAPLDGGRLAMLPSPHSDDLDFFDIDGVQLELVRYTFDADAKAMTLSTISTATAQR